jgi:CRP/FNR family transcriptional regulator
MSQIQNTIQSLRRVALFADLSDDELEFIANRAVPLHRTAGEMIFVEGETCQGLFVVQAGQIKIFKSSSEGREQVILIAGAGSTIAELPIFDDGPYPASAAALTDSALFEVRKDDVRQLCLERPEVALKLLRVVGARLRRLLSIIEELSFTTVRQRLATLLLHEAQINGRKTARGVEFVLPWTQQELAAQVGTVRELVSRNFSRFQSTGVLQIEGRSVLVPNLQTLKDESS